MSCLPKAHNTMNQRLLYKWCFFNLTFSQKHVVLWPIVFCKLSFVFTHFPKAHSIVFCKVSLFSLTLTTPPRNGQKITSVHTTEQTKKETVQLLRTIIVLSQTLQPLPDNVVMTMKIFYYDDGMQSKPSWKYTLCLDNMIMCIHLCAISSVPTV